MSAGLIVAEEYAEAIGAQLTGGECGREFVVFSYTDTSSNLTAFGITIRATGETVVRVPRSGGSPSNTVKE